MTDFTIDAETHYRHHQFIAKVEQEQDDWLEVVAFVKAENRKRLQRGNDMRKIRNQIVGGVSIVAILTFFGWFGTWVIKLLTSNAGG